MLMHVYLTMDLNGMCKTCHKRVQSFSRYVECHNCKCKHHAKCVRLDNASSCISGAWYCPPCIQVVLSFNHFDDDDDFCGAILEETLNCSSRFHEINNRVFSPFEINQDFDTPFSEIDPDLQFYTETNHIQNLKKTHSMPCFLIKKRRNASASFFHLNIKSLPKHHEEFCLLLESLRPRFSFVAVTETWLSDHTHELYGMPNYTMESRYRKCKKGGGVALYVNDNISYIVRKDLEHFDCEMESLFIEVDSKVFQTPSNIVIGIVYRMPDASIDIFHDRMADILNVINKENKLFYMLGDLNIDFLKCDEHRLTSSFIDTLYSNNVFPLITKPTRVTQSTATLIDHILTNNFDVMGNHKQGILCTDIGSLMLCQSRWPTFIVSIFRYTGKSSEPKNGTHCWNAPQY